MKTITIALFLFINPLFAQQTPTASNPLAQLKDQVKQALERARLPFSTEQENAIVLMMEDRRKASEDLFGDLMNFQAGPTQGQEADRLRSAIQWMETEFLSRLQDYLTTDQLAAWTRARQSVTAAASVSREQSAPPREQNQTQYVRINNNAFTGEDNGYRLFNRAPDRVNTAATEVIQRGGVGAWHGNIEFLLKDDALNAGRRFARNKPPYQERQTSVNISGPVIPDRLTTTFIFSQNEAKNSDTIRATLPDSIFALGVTKPTTNRSVTSNNTFQVSDATALSFNGGYTQNRLGMDVNATNSMGLTAVMGAANRGSDEIIQYLVDKGAKLDVKDREARTALNWAGGVFLATNPAKAKPSSMELIQKLLAAK